MAIPDAKKPKLTPRQRRAAMSDAELRAELIKFGVDATQVARLTRSELMDALATFDPPAEPTVPKFKIEQGFLWQWVPDSTITNGGQWIQEGDLRATSEEGRKAAIEDAIAIAKGKAEAEWKAKIDAKVISADEAGLEREKFDESVRQFNATLEQRREAKSVDDLMVQSIQKLMASKIKDGEFSTEDQFAFLGALAQFRDMPTSQQALDAALAYARSPADVFTLSNIARGNLQVAPPPEGQIQQVGPPPEFLTEAYRRYIRSLDPASIFGDLFGGGKVPKVSAQGQGTGTGTGTGGAPAAAAPVAPAAVPVAPAAVPVAPAAAVSPAQKQKPGPRAGGDWIWSDEAQEWQWLPARPPAAAPAAAVVYPTTSAQQSTAAARGDRLYADQPPEASAALARAIAAMSAAPTVPQPAPANTAAAQASQIALDLWEQAAPRAPATAAPETPINITESARALSPGAFGPGAPATWASAPTVPAASAAAFAQPADLFRNDDVDLWSQYTGGDSGDSYDVGSPDTGGWSDPSEADARGWDSYDWFAKGGIESGVPNLDIVGEEEPEVVDLPPGARVIPFSKLSPAQLAQILGSADRFAHGGVEGHEPQIGKRPDFPAGIQQAISGRSIAPPRSLMRAAGLMTPSAQAWRNLIPSEQAAFMELGRVARIGQPNFERELMSTIPGRGSRRIPFMPFRRRLTG